MASTVPQLFADLRPKSVDVGKVLAAVLVSAVTVCVFIFLHFVIRRNKYSCLIPTRRMTSFGLLGNLSDIPLTSGKRNGYNFNVFLVQLLAGYSQLFKSQKLFCFWISYAPFVMLIKAEAVEELLGKTKMMEKSWAYKWLHPWLGTGLLTSHGAKWKSRRKLLTPSFHFDILKEFIHVFNEQSQLLVKLLEEETEKPFTDMVMPITLCTLDIICETTLGASVSAQRNNDSEYVKAVLRASEIVMQRMVNPNYWPDWAFYLTDAGKQFKKDLKLLHSFTMSVIQDKKRRLLSGDPDAKKEVKKKKALMDLLLEHHIQNQTLTEEDVREEVDTFAFEGHDTTSMGITWALYLIGLHKDVQANIHEELDRIFGDDSDRPVTTDDLKDMECLERVLKESQRLYPSVPMFGRQVNEDTTIGDYRVPKGAVCAVLTFQLHKDEDVFPNPEKFDPDRFLPENVLNRHPYAYIPFSAGPRNCIGQRFAIMEEKIVVANILRCYTLESIDGRDKVLPAAELIMRASQPVRIKVRPRHAKV